MRSCPFCCTWAVILLYTQPALAGVYNFAEPGEGARGETFEQYYQTLKSLQNLAAEKVEFDYPLRRRYRLTADLGGKANPTTLSLEQKINLSAAFIRTRRYTEAIQLLAPLARLHPQNPFLHANLGTAYQLAGGQESRAIASLEQGLAAWPKDWDNLSEAKKKDWLDLGFSGPEEIQQRRAEEAYHLKLLKLRAREPGGSYEQVDALFGDGKKPVRFVGDSGKFEPGKIAKEEKAILDKVRKDGADPRPIDVVQQLLIWLPDDLRLQWLLAELYNAEGNLPAAKFYFAKLGGAADLNVPRVTAEEFRARRQIMLETELPEENGVTEGDMTKKIKENEEKRNRERAADVIDWRSLWVGVLIGGAVALFMLWQVKEWRRRKNPSLGRLNSSGQASRS